MINIAHNRIGNTLLKEGIQQRRMPYTHCLLVGIGIGVKWFIQNEEPLDDVVGLILPPVYPSFPIETATQVRKAVNLVMLSIVEEYLG